MAFARERPRLAARGRTCLALELRARHDSSLGVNRAELESLDKAALVDPALRQAERITELEARVATLKGQLAEMARRFEELEPLAVRGAVPFARPQAKLLRVPPHSKVTERFRNPQASIHHELGVLPHEVLVHTLRRADEGNRARRGAPASQDWRGDAIHACIPAALCHCIAARPDSFEALRERCGVQI